jgi:hypothetical protein
VIKGSRFPAAAGVVPLAGAVVSKGAVPKFRNGGDIITIVTDSKRVYYLKGSTAYETASWFEIISTCPGLANLRAADSTGSDSTVEADATSSSPVHAAAPGATSPVASAAASSWRRSREDGALTDTTVGAARAGPRAVNPVAELGVSGDVVACIAELSEEVRTAWDAVLAAALRARGLEQMQLVERELAVTQAEADTARITALEAEVEALRSSLTSRQDGVERLRSDVLQELACAAAQVEALREEAAGALEAALSVVCLREQQEGTDDASWASACRAVIMDVRDLVTEKLSRGGVDTPDHGRRSALIHEMLPQDVASMLLAVKRGIAELAARRDADTAVLASVVRDFAEASGFSVPVPALEIVRQFASPTLPASSSPQPLAAIDLAGLDLPSIEHSVGGGAVAAPPVAAPDASRRGVLSARPAPPPNKPPRDVLRSQRYVSGSSSQVHASALSLASPAVSSAPLLPAQEFTRMPIERHGNLSCSLSNGMPAANDEFSSSSFGAEL